MLTQLQRDIMEFAKRESFHGTLEEFLHRDCRIDPDEAEAALQDLKRRHIAAVATPIRTSFIGATNFGWKQLGWRN